MLTAAEAQVQITLDPRCRNNSVYPTWGDVRFFWHVKLINVAISPLQCRQHQNIVWICSQGQEGKILAATQTAESDGMCGTSYLILVMVLSGERGGKATDTTQRPESHIGTRLRWAEKLMVSSKHIRCAHIRKETRTQLLWAVTYMMKTKWQKQAAMAETTKTNKMEKHWYF